MNGTVVTDMVHEYILYHVPRYMGHGTWYKIYGMMQRVGMGTKDRAGKKRQAPHFGKLCFKAFDFTLQVSASPIFLFKDLRD